MWGVDSPATDVYNIDPRIQLTKPLLKCRLSRVFFQLLIDYNAPVYPLGTLIPYLACIAPGLVTRDPDRELDVVYNRDLDCRRRRLTLPFVE